MKIVVKDDSQKDTKTFELVGVAVTFEGQDIILQFESETEAVNSINLPWLHSQMKKVVWPQKSNNIVYDNKEWTIHNNKN